jgi:hypothetical protein
MYQEEQDPRGILLLVLYSLDSYLFPLGLLFLVKGYHQHPIIVQ